MIKKFVPLGQRDREMAYQQGVQQGAQQEAQAIALRLLDKKCDIQLISQVTRLSQQQIKLLAKKTMVIV